MINSKALSIVIATFNRHQDLKTVLQELFKQFKELSMTAADPKKVINDIELIIVDNNSSDETGSMIFNMISKKENGNLELKYLIEMDQGSSSARNRGIQESSGAAIAFIDDDILLDPNWLIEVYNFSKKHNTNYVYGARVIPLWSCEIPDWLSLEPPFELIQSCFPAHDYGTEKKQYPFYLDLEETDDDIDFLGPLSDKLKSLKDSFRRKISNPISACFLASRDVFEKYGNFRLDLGIRAKERGACEDTELFWRFIAAGVNVYYEPRIKVFHPIPATRMTKKFVLDWYKLLGKTLIYLQKNKLTHLTPNAKDTEIKLKLKIYIFRLMHILSFLLMDPIKSFWFETQASKAKAALQELLA